MNIFKKSEKLGLVSLTALVAGNMIGSGVFMLPSELARVGSISIFSWIFTAAGAFFLALVFSKMSHIIPKTGGPYAYARAGFGDFIGFQTAYTYWIAVLIGNAGVALALIGYLRVFFPILSIPAISTSVAILSIWLFTFINIQGIRTVGLVQIITTSLKFVPLLVVGLLGWWYFHPEYLTSSFNVTTKSNFSAFSYGATLTLWAFIGVESASVPADSVANPKRNIPLATLFGTSIAALVYIITATVIMGLLPANILANSPSPFAAAAKVIFGQWGEWIVALGATISCLGALNGWILIQGHITLAIAEDNLFPKVFAKMNKANVPGLGIIIGSTIITVLLLLTSTPNLVDQFQFIILNAAGFSLLAYVYTSIAEILILQKNKTDIKKTTNIIIAILAAFYSLWAIIGSGKDTVFMLTITILSSLFLYAIIKWEKS